MGFQSLDGRDIKREMASRYKTIKQNSREDKNLS